MIIIQNRLFFLKFLYLEILLLIPIIIFLFLFSLITKTIPALSFINYYLPIFITWTLLVGLFLSPWIIFQVEKNNQTFTKQIYFGKFLISQKNLQGENISINKYYLIKSLKKIPYYTINIKTESGFTSPLANFFLCWIFNIKINQPLTQLAHLK